VTGRDFLQKQHEIGESHPNQRKGRKEKKIEHTPSLSSLLMFNYYGELNIVASFIFSSRAGMMGNNKWHCDGNVI
jgi:hypothetical protein